MAAHFPFGPYVSNADVAVQWNPAKEIQSPAKASGILSTSTPSLITLEVHHTFVVLYSPWSHTLPHSAI